jgi:hypothetical protein
VSGAAGKTIFDPDGDRAARSRLRSNNEANGYKKAEEWGHRSQYWALNDDLSDLCLRETNLVDSMIKLQPKTPAGIAAVAAAFKADQNHFWKSPEADRDWDISLLPRFLDGLMDLGQRRPSPLC